MSAIFDNAKAQTKQAARDLRLGDIIEAYYMDSEEPEVCVVIGCTYNSKSGDSYDIRVLRILDLGQRQQTGIGSRLNTARWIKKGNLAAEDILHIIKGSDPVQQ